MPRVLDAERKALLRNLPKLLETARGRFVLIHRSTVVDTYATEDAALRAGYAKFGPHGAFLIDEVGADQRQRYLP